MAHSSLGFFNISSECLLKGLQGHEAQLQALLY